METSENYREKTPEIKNEWLYLAIPAVAIALAEMQMYLGRQIQSLVIHVVILLGLSISTMFIKNEDIQKTYQALILLPIMRIINLSVPVFYETTLYSLVFIYSLLAVPASIAATQQEFTRTQLGLSLIHI